MPQNYQSHGKTKDRNCHKPEETKGNMMTKCNVYPQLGPETEKVHYRKDGEIK